MYVVLRACSYLFCWEEKVVGGAREDNEEVLRTLRNLYNAKMKKIKKLPILSYKTTRDPSQDSYHWSRKHLCVERPTATRDCFFDTRNWAKKAIFVCRSPIIVCRPSTRTKIYFCLRRICAALWVPKMGIY